MDPVITAIISFCLSLLFAVAVIHKLRAPAVFRAAMDEYQLLPAAVSGLASFILMAAEAVAAVMVLIPAARTGGFVIMLTLLLVYSTGISINLLRGRRDIDCGCNGPADKQLLSWWLVIRNLFFAGLAVAAMQPATGRVLNWLDFMTVLFAVLVATGLYQSLKQILARLPAQARLRNSI